MTSHDVNNYVKQTVFIRVANNSLSSFIGLIRDCVNSAVERE